MPDPSQQLDFYGWAGGNPEITGDITGYAYPSAPMTEADKAYAALPPNVRHYMATAPSITDANPQIPRTVPGYDPWSAYAGWQDESRAARAGPSREQPYYGMMARNIQQQYANYPRSEGSIEGRSIRPDPLTQQMHAPGYSQGDVQPRLYRLPNGQYVPMHQNPDGTLSIPTQTAQMYNGNPNSFYWNPPGYRTPQPSIWEYLANANGWAFPEVPMGMDTAIMMSGGYGDQGAAPSGSGVTTPGPGKKP